MWPDFERQFFAHFGHTGGSLPSLRGFCVKCPFCLNSYRAQKQPVFAKKTDHLEGGHGGAC